MDMDTKHAQHNQGNPTPRASRLAPRTGFTLVELLVVIAIIGILVSLVTVAAVGALKKARETQIKTELNEIASGIEEYKNKTTAYPPNCQTDDNGVLDEAGIVSDVRRHIKQLAPRSQEMDDLALVLTGRAASNTTNYPRPLAGGITAGEAVVFWLGGFSSDPKFPLSGEGGPSYPIQSFGAADNAKLDPIESRKWVYPFDVSRLGPRDPSTGYFTGNRFVEYRDPKGTLRRINFWQYIPAKSDQPYLYFDTSRHPAISRNGATTTGLYDPPAATLASGAELHVHAFKKASESTGAGVPMDFATPNKYQVLHCGIDNAWGDEAIWERMSHHGVKAAGGNVDDPGSYLLFPAGPFVGDIADTIVNFIPETRIEDAQKK
jgi:prepilin-type N-terminal cleavage/methylation domain-containing protein